MNDNVYYENYDNNIIFNQFSANSVDLINTMNNKFRKIELSQGQYDYLYKEFDNMVNKNNSVFGRILWFIFLIGIYAFLIMITFNKSAENLAGGIFAIICFTIFIVIFRYTGEKSNIIPKAQFDCISNRKFDTFEVPVTDKRIRKHSLGNNASRGVYIISDSVTFETSVSNYNAFTYNDTACVVVFCIDDKYYFRLLPQNAIWSDI